MCHFLAVGMEIPRHKAERGDAERVSERLDFREPRHALIELSSQAHIVGDHPHIALAPRLLNGKPDLQSAKTARILRPEVKVIDSFGAEMIVGRMICKCVAQ